jgi:uncharacterized surface protein with fasciclin (FAS1) repeats
MSPKKTFRFAALLCAGLVVSAPAIAADVVATAAAAGGFTTLLAAAKAAGLADTLATKQGITLFAPTDEAFAKLPKGTVANLLKPENKEKLQAILLYHVLPSEVNSGQVPTRLTAVATLDGAEEVRVRRRGNSVTVNKSHVIKADIASDNGIIHVIDRVLIPGQI